MLVVVCVVPTVLTMTILVYRAYKGEAVTQELIRIETARALMQAVDRELSSAQGTLQALATSPYLTTNDLRGFHVQAREVQSLRPSNNFVLSDSSGRQLVNTLRRFGDTLPGHGNPDQLRRVFATGRPVISDLYSGAVLRRPVISIDVPVIRNGKVKYDLSMGFLPAYLGEILRLQRIPPHSVAAIFDSKGVIVARTWDAERFVGHKGAPELVKRMEKVREDSIEAVTLEGVSVTTAFSRSTVSNWTVAIGVPRVIILRRLWTSISRNIGISVLLLIAALILAKSVAGRIAGSILQLLAPASALGRGEPVAIPALPLKEANDVAQVLLNTSELLRQRTFERDAAERAERALRTMQERLKRSEAFQRRIFDEAPNAILIVAGSGSIVRANAEAERLFGYDAARLLELSVEDLMPTETGALHRKHRETYFENPVRRPMGNNGHFLARHADGSIFPVDVMLSPLVSNGDAFVIATVRDITQLRRNEERISAALREKDTLLKELYHRVKNNLQVVASMMNLQERAIPDRLARTALTEAADRVRAMALVHEKLYQSGNLSAIDLDDYVSTICRQLGEAADAARRGIGIETDIQQIQVGIETAIPLGIVLNELISNSLKHAFPAGCAGRIVVSLVREDGEMLRLTVADNGVGYPDGFTPTSTRSLGLKLVLALAGQLGGRFSISNQGGAVATLVFSCKEHSS